MKQLRVLVACEFSGIVRDAFTAAGHLAMSCDLDPTETPGWHYQGDIFDVVSMGWDLAICHPPCTYLANSGSKHLYLGMKKSNGINPERWRLMEDGAAFFRHMMELPIPRICVENPIQHEHARKLIGVRQDQIIQPYHFGHGETKATCLWLKSLPKLQPTDIVDGRKPRVHFEPPGPQRPKNRSRTMRGIAAAMSAQWGILG